MTRHPCANTSFTSGATIGLFLLVTPAFGGTSCKDEKCVPGIPCIAETTSGFSLQENKELCFGSLTISAKSIFVTKSFNLTIRVEGTLVVQPGVIIKSFDDNDNPPTPPNMEPAERGASYDRGPGTEGRSPARSGEAGTPGLSRTPGQKGAAAGQIVIEVGGDVLGDLQIDARGQNGGKGGSGQDGGRGGDGEQGARGTPDKKLGVVVGCKAGGGQGGNGGPGGPAGRGGGGGEGGSGGTVVLALQSDALATHFKTNVAGGMGGSPGSNGTPGTGGDFGYGGRGAAGCQGEELHRQGLAGPAGPPVTEDPAMGNIGGHGSVKITKFQ